MPNAGPNERQGTTMPKHAAKQTVNFSSVKSFAELVAKRPEIFGEDPGAYRTFHANLMQTLAPEDSYEYLLADELIQICWQINQTRHLMTTHMRQNLLDRIYLAADDKFEEQYELALEAEQTAHRDAGGKNDTFTPTVRRTPKIWADCAQDLASRATSLDPITANKAHRELEEMGIDPSQMMHAAYFEPGTTHKFDRLDERQHTLERRRRELQRDYERLQDRRPIDASATDL